MSSLKRKLHNEILIPELCVAKTFAQRLQGLWGTSSLSNSHGLWIHQCRSIHTFFMKYPIDCVFVNEELEICSLNRNVKPWRMTSVSWRASSVIELAAGQIDRLGLKVGEVLDVGN